MTDKPSPEGATAASVLLLIGRMDGKLDLLLTRHDQHERRLEAHDGRITSLESSKNKAVGWLAAIAAVAGAGSAKLAALLNLLQ